jgi:hypothetical protein
VTVASCVILGCVLASMLLSMLYFRRCTISHPPIGVINLWDVAFLLAAIVVVPYLYLGLPSWLVTTLLALSMAGLLYILLGPILRRALLAVGITALIVAADIFIAWRYDTSGMPYFVVNNAVLIAVVVGFSNLWAQGGMPARALAILAGALAIYDYVFTERLSLMGDLFAGLAAVPFAPILAWPAGSSQWVGLGLGDLIIATLAPLVLRKAYGRSAGMAAIAVNTVAVALLLLLLAAGVRMSFAVMVLLGPLIVLQYFYWQWQHGFERTTWQYLQAEPLRQKIP